jgi:hypothetical protein
MPAKQLEAFLIPGRLPPPGIAAADQLVDSRAELDELLATGAFAASAKEAKAKAWTTDTPEPNEPAMLEAPTDEGEPA